MLSRSLFLCALTTLGTTPALAAGWEETFAPERVGSYVAEGAAVVVVAAGGVGASQRQALRAFINGLRDSGRPRLVMDQKGLGKVDALGDEEIVQRCAELPVDAIAIMRLFPGARSASPTAVVTFYDRAGQVQGALSAQRGLELEAKAERPSDDASKGVRAEAAEAVAGIAKTQSKSKQQAVERFEKEVIWFEDMVAVNQQGQAVSSWSNVYRGKYKQPLSSEEFYEAVGRPDLAEEYRENAAMRSIVMVPGAVLGVVGLTAATFCWLPILVEDQIGEQNVMPAILGLGIGGGAATLVGLGMGMVGGWMPLDPVTPAEARELADTHNKGLATELGLLEE